MRVRNAGKSSLASRSEELLANMPTIMAAAGMNADPRIARCHRGARFKNPSGFDGAWALVCELFNLDRLHPVGGIGELDQYLALVQVEMAMKQGYAKP